MLLFGVVLVLIVVLVVVLVLALAVVLVGLALLGVGLALLRVGLALLRVGLALLRVGLAVEAFGRAIDAAVIVVLVTVTEAPVPVLVQEARTNRLSPRASRRMIWRAPVQGWAMVVHHYFTPGAPVRPGGIRAGHFSAEKPRAGPPVPMS